jgi:LytS/YehU family sensor histidine kinase
MLYNTSTDVVPLEKEISYLKSYISLQQIRLKDPAFVKVDINGNCSDKTIAPMLFIPFVENAFKHGRKNVAAPGIRIRLECQDDSIFFEVANHSGLPSGLNKDRTAGIGMANTRRRLELLYPGRHKLSFEKKDGMYISRLTIRS